MTGSDDGERPHVEVGAKPLARRDRRARRVKTPTVLQMEVTECGAAALGMVLGYFGHYESPGKLREACGVSRNGSKASLIVKAARKYGLDARGFEVTLDELDSLPLPMILFWEFNHFVVYEGRRGNHFFLNDPASGPRRVPREVFEAGFTGVALTFAPGPDFRRTAKPKGVIRTLLPLAAGMKSTVTALIWGGLLLVLPGIIIPTAMRIFVDKVMVDRPDWLVLLLLLLGLTVAFQIALEFLVKLALRRGELQLTVDRTLGMLYYLFRLPLEFFQQRDAGDLQSRLALNTGIAKSAFGSLADNAVKLFTAVFFLGLMLQFSAFLTLVAVATALLNLGILVLTNRYRQVLNQSLLLSDTRLFGAVNNGTAMMETLRAAGREDEVFAEWSGHLAELNRQRQKMAVSDTLFGAAPGFLLALNNILILCFGARQIMQGELTLGGMMAFQILMGSFIGPLNALIGAGAEIQLLKAGIDRVNDVFSYAPERRFASGDAAITEMPEAVTFEMRDITFGYSRQAAPLLDKFNLKIASGQRVALVGISGSGKSTVARLAAGLLTPWSGEILINGRPIGVYSQEAFHKTVGFVDQSVMLFTGTVPDNLTLFAPRYDGEIMHQAVRDAALEKELAGRGPLPEIAVREEGANFSGGQRQRLEIARVLMQQPPLLILDEATSALDPVTEHRIDQALRRRGSACLIVAHRLSTIRDCDEILLMSEGSVIERGAHAELMAQNGFYATLMQLEGGL